MRQILSLLLVPLCLLGQMVCPHAHCGTEVTESLAHSARPHIHLSGGHEDCHGLAHGHRDQDHSNSDEKPFWSESPLTDHDHGVLYLTCHDFGSRIVVAKQTIDLAPLAVLSPTTAKLDSELHCRFVSCKSPPEPGGLAIYLRDSALRI